MLNGADGFLCCRAHDRFRKRRAFSRGPQPGQRADKFAVFEMELRIAPPLGSAAKLGGRKPTLAKLGEEGPPVGLHSVGVFQIARVQILDEGGIASEEERGRFEGLIAGAPDRVKFVCHFNILRPILRPVPGLRRSRLQNEGWL